MLSGVPKRLKHFQSLLVDVVRVEVLSHCAIVHVWQLAPVRLLIEEKVVDIYQVDVSNLLLSLLVSAHIWGLMALWSVIHSVAASLCYFTDVAARSLILDLRLGSHWEWVEIAFLSLETQTHVKVMKVVILFCLSVEWETIRTQNVLKPGMAKQLWKCDSFFGLNYQHSLDQVLGLLWYRDWELDPHLELALIKSLHSLGPEWDCPL